MTRTLPWLKPGQPAGVSKSASHNDGATTKDVPKKRPRFSTPAGSDSDLDLNTTGVSTPQRKAHLQKPKSPSTFPPPAPPKQEPMREGYTADDIWIMVEDEFLSTAQLYTQHLHHAEYQRLKRLAKEREVTTISRPVEGKTLDAARTALQAVRQAERKKTAEGSKSVTGLEEDDREDDDPWLRDPQLAGLMESPRKPAQLLKGLSTGRTHTKRSSEQPQKSKITHTTAYQSHLVASDRQNKHSQSASRTNKPQMKFEQSEEEADEDDLDAPTKFAIGKSQYKTQQGRDPFMTPAPSRPQRHRLPKANHSPDFADPKKTSDPLPLFDDIPISRRSENAEVSQYLAKRKAKAAKKEDNEKRQPCDTNEIPTFLF